MQKFIVDRSTWRCGGEDSDNQIGKGTTGLLNEEGFMCCLGQIGKQLEVPEHLLLDNGSPWETGIVIPGLTYPFPQNDGDKEDVVDTPLSISAMQINDDEDTSIEEKEEMLKELFATKEIELEFINEPVIP